MIVLIMYVGDIILVVYDEARLNSLEKKLANELQIKDLEFWRVS